MFLLSPPRSGSTLLRVMLAGNPRLFAPPELELLGFNTMDERREAFTGRDSFWLEGVIRAVMEIRSCDPEEAKEWIASCERDGWTTQRFYRQLQERLGDRMLVDKTPSYALEMSVLERAEAAFDEPFYLHLIRHPYGMIHSFEEAKLEQVFFRRPHSYERRELAELVWLASQQNITEFLGRIPAERRIAVHFEELVREPERVLRGICETLGLEYHPEMAQPYQEKRQRMTDGVYAASRMLGDVKFHQHRGVSSAAADRWMETYREDFLGGLTCAMAASFGYEDRPRQAPRAIEAVAWAPDSPRPVSFGQERLWFLDQFEPGSPFYNIPVAIGLRGPLDPPALQLSLQEIVRRHDVLRTTFDLRDGEPVQIVAPELPLTLARIDLSALPQEARSAELRGLIRDEAAQPFDLRRGPLFRATLVRASAEEHALLLTLHHIVADGWSMGVLRREMSAFYDAFREGRPSGLPELPIQYADFAAWQRAWLSGETLRRETAWWRDRLTGAPTLLELPTDRPRPAVQTFRGGRVRMAIPAPLADGLKALGRKRGATGFMTALAVFDALLARYSGQEDLVVGSPIAGRTRGELEGLIGLFINTLALRTGLSGDPSFAEILERVRRTTTEAYAHQELPFEKLVADLAPVRSLAHAPIFQVMLVLQNAAGGGEARLGEAIMSGLAIEAGTAKFDLLLSLTEHRDGLFGGWQYDADLFDETSVARMAAAFERLVEGALAHPETPLSALPVLPAAAWAQVVTEWNDTAGVAPALLVHEAFAAAAARTPEAVAVVFEERALTYGELDRRSNQLAHSLRSLGVGPDVLVGLGMERSPEMVIGLLGVLKAGGAYLPLDPSYPKERLAYMLEDSGARVLLTREDELEGLRSAALRVRLLPDAMAIDLQPETPTAAAARPESLAYVIYTSGSTGRPKGVQIPHGAFASFLAAMEREPGLTERDALVAVTTLSFDIAGLELFLPLTVGARVVLASREQASDGVRLMALIQGSGATVMQATPATWRMLLESGWPGAPGLKVLCGGEALPRELADRLVDRVGELWNVYGPTEATVWASASRRRKRGEDHDRPSDRRLPLPRRWTAPSRPCRWGLRASCSSAALAWRAATWPGRS